MLLNLKAKDLENLKKNYQEAMKDEKFKKIVSHLKLTEEEGMKKTSKIQNTIEELNNCKECKGVYNCKNAYKGHVSMPEKKEEGLYFTYIPCKYKKREVVERKRKQSEEQINENARMKDIDVTDKNRIKVIKWLDNFYENFSFSKKIKGLYLHGNFGSGKTFLISALFHELEEKKNVTTKVIYYPEMLKSLKADWEIYGKTFQMLETVDLLCFDDIGAEKITEWSRDEVLGTILQTRMSNNLPTFFTSNLTLEELENHFCMNSNSDEKIKSRRIMERIKQLSENIEMIKEI